MRSIEANLEKVQKEEQPNQVKGLAKVQELMRQKEALMLSINQEQRGKKKAHSGVL